MLTHYFTLQSLAYEFNERLHNAIIQQIFTQQRNELLVSCSVGDNTWTLSASCNPRLNYVFLRESVARAKKNSVDLFDDAVSLHILGATLHPFDRILQIQLENDSVLCFQLFGPTANILLIDREMVITDAFKRKRELVGQTFDAERKEDPLKAMSSPNAFEEALRMQGAKNVFAALKTAILSLGSTLAREVLHRSKIDEKTPLKNVSSDEVSEVQKRVHQVLDEVRSPHPTLYYRGDIPRLFSLIPLQHFTGSRAQEFPSVNDAVRTFVIQTFRTQVIDAEKNLLLSKIKTTIDRLQRSMGAIQTELQHASRAEEYDRIAKIIMANLQHLTKGTKAIDLPDIFSGGKQTHIALDPKLTPAQNAERYFDKAKSARRAYGETERRAEAVKKDIALLEKMQLHLDSCSTKEQLKEFWDDYNDDLLRLKLTKPKSGGEEIPFRVFTVAGGFQVWAGKNSENNDLLTMRHTRPNDLWFHARGGGGSHVVLKVGTSSGNPSKESIQEAARIAAYYSKMRKAKMVPVGYCERKYVKKPKGASAGTVTLQREKVVFAEPALPVGAG
jgi:predicted ribosome quality control (RQC) complex YloA/Tae2 family protein